MTDKKEEALRTLRRLAHAVYCGQAPWPSSTERNKEISQMCVRAGLFIPVPGAPSGDFTIAEEPDLELLLFVIGLNEPTDAVDDDAFGLSWDDLEHKSEAEALPIIKRAVFAAYERRFMQQTGAQ
jgi:hypothetical protein